MRKSTACFEQIKSDNKNFCIILGWKSIERCLFSVQFNLNFKFNSLIPDGQGKIMENALISL